ncbi:50S ribosomal protein L11 [Entomospira culicis]|uniref:Large ribosomal subunit protein uL11 n=1 Tax=Entomospira culicis TaxID=2719989 RepID=A0A968L063_9SPIO|nr:50S ribosomal protein L11 [Entomospira culicis]NIZ19797.1 50S ribosomal protein L11 [Entomospira culicis]NIZ70011.1 50S ribosomal protein L11 [Entomospira culicis]WDI37116.1 50S ribosomal protein L11 [Entomospira culicis]WDI38745.1 50S ribosomal protein L11 [Entomospira culicis]
MAKKKVTAIVKLQCPAGSATPAPPVGPALGPHGVSAPEFVKQFNDRTSKMEKGLIIPCEITIFADRTFTFILKTPPAAVLIKKAIGLDKGSAKSHIEKVGKITKAQIEEIAKLKAPDLNAIDLDGGVKIIAGTARSMGVTVEG